MISYYNETIDLNNGSTSNITINNNIEYTGWPVDPPVAMVSSDISEGETPLYINFFSSGSGDPNGEIVSYKWNFHDGSTSTNPNPSHTFTDTRTYAVTLIVTDEDGFKDMDYLLITVGADEIFVGLDNTYLQDNTLNLNVYPNPMSSETTIGFKLTKDSKINIDVCDISGKQIVRLFKGNLNSGNHEITWDGRNENGNKLLTGIYIIKFNINDGLYSKKIVVK